MQSQTGGMFPKAQLDPGQPNEGRGMTNPPGEDAMRCD